MKIEKEENRCDNCLHPNGYHHLCRKGKCKCKTCILYKTIISVRKDMEKEKLI